MRHYAALDVSNKITAICVVDERDKIIVEEEVKTHPKDISSALTVKNLNLATVVIESGSLSHYLVSQLRAMGFPAVCVDARHMAQILSTTINKTDKNDARGMAIAARANFVREVHLKNAHSAEILVVQSNRKTIVQQRVQISNAIRGVLKTYGLVIKASGEATFLEAVRSHQTAIDEYAWASIEVMLDQFQACIKHEAEMNRIVKKLCKGSEVVARLQTAPGIGPITALAFVATVDDPSRFNDCRNIGAYLGLTPRQHSSGEVVRMGGISRCGEKYLRSLLYEAAITIITRSKKHSKLKAWAMKIKRRSGIKCAATALARQLSIVLLRMWQTGESFRFTDVPQEKELAA